ncbi:MAG: CARDB domain-containing protein [Candidatus Solibacter sp.]|jgi:uncharacterized protein (TIGR03437 family)
MNPERTYSPTHARTGETLASSTPQAAAVLLAMMTRNKPATCDSTLPPVAETNFLTIDTQAFVWFFVTGAQYGDRVAVEFDTPTGQVYTAGGSIWDPLSAAGNYCFTSLPLVIAGAAPANLVGRWTAKITINNQMFGSVPFNILRATCSYSLSPTAQNIDPSGGNGSVSVTATSGCTWTASSGVNWITIQSGASGSGNGTVTYAVAVNTGPSARTGALTIGGQTLTVAQAAGCSYSLSGTSQTIGAGGGNGSVGVMSGSGCAWTASSGVSWITIQSGASGTGNGTVTYTVASNNTSSARTGALTIGGQTFTVAQAAGASLPDLVVTAFTAATTGMIGAKITGSATLVNRGTAAAGHFWFGFYLSKNPNVTTNDIDTGYGCATDSIAVNASWSCGGDIGIPATVAPGVYYLAAIADAGNEVVESDKTNNMLVSSAGPITLTAPLVVTSVSQILPQQNQTITITGSGFGSQLPYIGDSAYLEIEDTTLNWGAGLRSNTGADTVSLVVTSWTDSQITVAGFQGAYGQFGYVLQPGDQVQVRVWSAPAGAGPATFNMTVQAAGSSGPSITSVLNGASFQPGIASGTWIAIAGSNLAPNTPNGRTWAGSDFNGNSLPTALDGVSVTVNGKKAYVYYISPSQINAVAPGDTTVGIVSVQVTTSNGQSNVLSVAKAAASPGIFTYSNSHYAIATVASGFIGPAGYLAPSTRPAVPGEIMTFWVTGLGATTPPYPEGQIPQAAPLASDIQVTIGGAAATVQYAGINGPGLYQINLYVPSLPSGDAAVAITLNGIQSAPQVFIPVGKAAGSASVDLTSAYNITGIYTDGTTFSPNGGVDGTGAACSAVLLGATQVWNGATFTFGPANSLNAVTGKTVALPAGQFGRLGVLAIGINGGQVSQTFTVKYTDGTSSTFSQSVSDWYSPQHYAGESVALQMQYRVTSAGGKDGRPFDLYGYSFNLSTDKTVSQVSLPGSPNVVVLAMTLGPAQ